MEKVLLRAKKEELKKEWEGCFETQIECVLNKKGLEKFWSVETSVTEATELLIAAAVGLLIDTITVTNTKSEKPYRIIVDGRLRDEKFRTVEGAENFKEELAKTTSYTINDIHIVQEM